MKQGKARTTALQALETVDRCTTALNQFRALSQPIEAEKRAALQLLSVYHRRGIVSQEEYRAALQSGKSEKGAL